MTLASALLSPFHFTRFPVTILAGVLYALAFASFLYSDRLPQVIQTKAFERALTDLANITARPHPYISHANDHVRSYLLSRIQSLSPDLEVIDDLNSTVKIVQSHKSPKGIFFEGSNILVKVPGSEQDDTNAVLFSAHFDSVSVAPGATDNGMGVIGTLQLLEYLVSLPVEERPRRTAIFNFNNNEEDGLYGSYSFLVHPWSNLTTTFLNVEGAGAGGRPMLFRGTSLAPIASFINAHPSVGFFHAVVLSQDVFGRGLIKSNTDWSVYGQKMDGLDLAFYKNRAFYHTPQDSLAYAEGGPRSFQAMIESIRYGGLGLLNAEYNASHPKKDPVYFEVLGRFYVITELSQMFKINIFSLVVGPIIIIILSVITFMSKKDSTGSSSASDVTGSKFWRVTKVALGIGQFLISLVVVTAAQVGIVALYLKKNPFVIHSYPYLVLSSVMLLSYLGVVLPITQLQSTGISASKSKFVSSASLYIFTWILLVVSTLSLHKYKIAGTYWVTIWNVCSFMGLLVVLVQSMIASSMVDDEEVVENDDDSTRDGIRKYLRGIRHHSEPGGSRRSRIHWETEPTEVTPLMHGHERERQVDTKAAPAPKDEIGWWILQMIITLPVPVVLINDITIPLLVSLNQTMVDGSNSLIVYVLLSVLCTFMLLPLTPFAHRIHGFVTWAAFIGFILISLFCCLAFPFTQGAPMKVKFKQFVELDSTPNFAIQQQSYGSLTPTLKATTRVVGLGGYVEQVVASLSSSRGQNVTCLPTPGGLVECKWDVQGEWLPSPGGDSEGNWLEAEVTRVNEASAAIISVRGKNTRQCRIYFDSPVSEYEVRNVDGEGWSGQTPDGYTMPADEVKMIDMWSRAWERKFDVQVKWKGVEGMSGRVTCQHAEFLSGVADGEVSWNPGTNPAFEDLLIFAPTWSTVTRDDGGMVEIWRKFSI